jgi:hypothetical protein
VGQSGVSIETQAHLGGGCQGLLQQLLLPSKAATLDCVTAADLQRSTALTGGLRMLFGVLNERTTFHFIATSCRSLHFSARAQTEQVAVCQPSSETHTRAKYPGINCAVHAAGRKPTLVRSAVVGKLQSRRQLPTNATTRRRGGATRMLFLHVRAMKLRRWILKHSGSNGHRPSLETAEGSMGVKSLVTPRTMKYAILLRPCQR